MSIGSQIPVFWADPAESEIRYHDDQGFERVSLTYNKAAWLESIES